MQFEQSLTTFRIQKPARRLSAALLAPALLALVLPAAARAAVPPSVSSTSFDNVTTTAVTFHATVNPNGKDTTYRLQYTTEAEWQSEGEQFGPGAHSTTPTTLPAKAIGTGDLTLGSPAVTNLTTTAGTFAKGQTITGTGAGVPAGATILEVKPGPGGLPELILSQNATATATGVALTAATGSEPVSVALSSLGPATAYRARFLAHSIAGDSEGETVAFATYPEGIVGLPDGRAYEQATPLDKDAGDAGDYPPYARAASGGDGVIFGSTSGIPGGEGAQELPFYLASRSPGGWLSSGLNPPATLGNTAKLLGWTPDFSEFFQSAGHLGAPTQRAIFARSAAGVETQITTYLPTTYAYAGASADASKVLFESTSGQLPSTPAGREGFPNVYVWDRETGALRLADVMNDQTPPAKGAFAGPYEWMRSKASEGGAAADMYVQDPRAVSADGSLFFTTAGPGHIYQRRNPTQPQSNMSAGQCIEAAKACTLDVSASHRTQADSGGPRPAAFQAASAGGDTAFFTSPEELTDDAKTGPPVQEAKLGRVMINASGASEEPLPDFLDAYHALGLATDGTYLYWADPATEAIARAKLGLSGPEAIEDPFIEPGETCFETHPVTEPGVSNCAPSTPRYVAVHGSHIYWTNTGPLGGDNGKTQLNGPVEGAGTIGRAELHGAEPADHIDPEFIAGASNPQGIAANGEYIFWANSLESELKHEHDIAQAKVESGQVKEVDQRFFSLPNNYTPFDVALSGSRLYWTAETTGSLREGYVQSIELDGSNPLSQFVDFGLKPRGIAILGPRLYWAGQGTGAIGRIPLADINNSGCAATPTCEPEFLKPGGSLIGLTADPAETHLYWSVNGEVPLHPGNDLYRFRAPGSSGCSEAGGCLTDLTLDPGEENGAEVLGVLGASEDGTRAYFVANGVLASDTVENGAGPEVAQPGNCHGNPAQNPTGNCNLYLWEDDGKGTATITFLARLDGPGSALDWLGGIHGGAVEGAIPKTSFLNPDGAVLLFASSRRLTVYDNQGTNQLYLYRIGQGIVCISCDPTLSPGRAGGGFGSITPVALRAAVPATVASHNLSADGRRVFFETSAALVPQDTNGAAGCPVLQSGNSFYHSCTDTYEWEAPGADSCSESSPAYSPVNGGCLFLISRGRGEDPSLLLDASASGNDVFFFSREALVGQDEDQLRDVYDARVGGGLASQNPPPSPPPCEAESCKPAVTLPPATPSPVTPEFRGEENLHEKPCSKSEARRGSRCVKRHHRRHKKQKRRHGRAHR